MHFFEFLQKFFMFQKVLFSDLCHGWVLVECKHKRQPLSKAYVQQFLHKNGAQLCSYLVCRFVFGQG